MAASAPTPASARPIPKKLQSTSTSVSRSVSSPASNSPDSPSSTFSPESTTRTSMGTDYFGDSAVSSPSDRTFLQRLTSPTFRHDHDLGREPSKSPTSDGSRRPKSFSVAAPLDRSWTASAASSGGPLSPSAPPGRTLKRSSGTYTQCGRHSNDWLFGGVSVRETVKGLFEHRK